MYVSFGQMRRTLAQKNNIGGEIVICILYTILAPDDKGDKERFGD